MKHYRGFKTQVNLVDGNMGGVIADMYRQVTTQTAPPPPPPPTAPAPAPYVAPVLTPPPVIQVPPSIPTGYFDEPAPLVGVGPSVQPPTGGSPFGDDMGPLDLGVEIPGAGVRPFDPNDPFAPVSIGPLSGRGSGPAGALFPGSGQEIDAPILDANGKPIQSTAFPVGVKGAKVPLTQKQKQNLGIAAAVALFVLFGA